MTALFDRYAIVDWSAANAPTTGKDSLWIAFAARDGGEARLLETINPPTRAGAMAHLRQFLREALAEGKRVFLGFDLPLGFPAGAAEAIAGKPDWSALWGVLHELVQDRDDNFSNRFEVGGRLNRGPLAGTPMFWGRPAFQDIPGLPATRPEPYPSGLPERRACEARAPRAQPVWKLALAGSVGSQAITGIARIEALRRDPEFAGRIAVWPFETGFEERLDGPVVVAEVHSALFPVEQEGHPCLDAAQVSFLAEHFARLDAASRFAALLSAPNDRMSEREARAVMGEEGWMVGLGHPLGLGAGAGEGGAPAIAPAAPAYLKDIGRIRAEERRLALAEADLSGLPEESRDFALRLVESCAMPEILADLVIAGGALDAGRAAMEAGAAILCDSETVAHGISARDLPHANRIVCRLADPRVARLAEREGTTRFAAQVDLWNDQLDGAVVAIGEAPTALFRLLERLDAGAPRPALILAFPVGFVGAAEAQEELARDDRGVPFVALRGRRGGAFLASAAVNALAQGGAG